MHNFLWLTYKDRYYLLLAVLLIIWSTKLWKNIPGTQYFSIRDFLLEPLSGRTLWVGSIIRVLIPSVTGFALFYLTDNPVPTAVLAAGVAATSLVYRELLHPSLPEPILKPHGTKLRILYILFIGVAATSAGLGAKLGSVLHHVSRFVGNVITLDELIRAFIEATRDRLLDWLLGNLVLGRIYGAVRRYVHKAVEQARHEEERALAAEYQVPKSPNTTGYL